MNSVDEVKRARESFEQRAWGDAYDRLSRADESAPLTAEDLEVLGMSAYLIGRDDDMLAAMERAHLEHLNAGNVVHAARCAFWIGFRLFPLGEVARATGWLGRAERLLENEIDCVENGYLLLPLVLQYRLTGDYEAARVTAASATEIGQRFADADLLAFALHELGRALIKQGEAKAGLALLDEAMVAVTAGELSPLMTGLIYCSVIEACQEIYELGRAHEWTAALTQWCAQQPELVAYSGACLVHRAEIMRFHGSWLDAVAEAQRACERFSLSDGRQSAAAAYYQQAEIYRLRGEISAAEEAYRNASGWGWEPQPGLALLRLIQGRTKDAVASIRRVLGETTDPLARARLLPAYVEAMLSADEIAEARTASHELDQIAKSHEQGALGALAAFARGSVELADGDPQAALHALRRAGQVWHELQAPYEIARVRMLVGLACHGLDDHDTATLELHAARDLFERLGAAPDLARLESLPHLAPDDRKSGLTPREQEVLSLVASGKTNKAIAAELVISEKTVDRHVTNIFTKLSVSSRAAATAYAYEHKII